MIRFVKNQDYEGWKKLYLQYGEFYQVPMTHEGLSKVWNWLQDSSHEMEGLVYEKTGRIVGLAHFRRMPNPLSCLLYTSPSPRDRTRSRMPSSA